MNNADLAETLQKLRDFTSAQGMQWVLDEVDQAISLGVPETRTLRQATRGGRTTYEDITDDLLELPRPDTAARGSRRSEQFIRRRAMTPLEQAQLLIEALRRVLIELPDVAIGSLDAINGRDRDVMEDYRKDPSGSTLPFISDIYFFPDEGDISPSISVDGSINREHTAHVLTILTQIEEEINS